MNETKGTSYTRRLSEEGRRRAVDYGKQLLATNRQNTPINPESDVVDLGSEMVFVLYLENEKVHSLMVTSDS